MNMPSGSGEQMSVAVWDPHKYLRTVDAAEARLSRGFLRCRPERWFPGFSAHWLPLAHSLGVELRLTDARPVLKVPPGLSTGFSASVDGEPLGLYLDDASRQQIVEVVCPGVADQGSSVVTEYLARRFLSSLVSAWSGPESSVVQFESETDPFSVQGVGAVKLTAELNKHHVTIWILMGRLLVERLDGLWRRQIRSSARADDKPSVAFVELAQLAVPPSMLSEYLKPGTVIDLEIPVMDQVTLRLANKPWLPARLCRLGDGLGVEVISGPVTSANLPEGTTRVSVCMGSIKLEPYQALELAQVGVLWETGIPVGDKVSMIINSEQVSEAQLCTFEGRFALTVL